MKLLQGWGAYINTK
jgi:hypothetical protein